MQVKRHEWAEWRDFPLTKELLKEIEIQSNAAIAQIINRRLEDFSDDQYLKGMISAFSQVVGWTPEFLPEDGDDIRIQDAVEEEFNR